MEPIVMVMKRGKLEWFGHVKITHETENIRAVVEMKMEWKRPRQGSKLGGKARSQLAPRYFFLGANLYN